MNFPEYHWPVLSTLADLNCIGFFAYFYELEKYFLVAELSWIKR
jgi:hypothetical protein